MTTLRVLEPAEPADAVAVGRLHDAAEVADGHPSLNESVWRDLDAGGHPGSAGVLATDGETATGYAHVARSDSFSPPHWEIGLVVHPDHRDTGLEVELLDAAVQHIAREGGGPAVLWLLGADAHDDAVVAGTGFAPQRDLLQMRVALPLAEQPTWPPGTEVRTFVPGQDDDAWLEVNNRAFANHPEQGGWIRDTLRRRLAEPWFDPRGFLLAFDERGLAGFCWTKIHPPEPGAPDVLGEIFVIGVDPSRHGTGLGRALTVAGLASLAGPGARVGMLYVDGTNEPALRLYRSLGFEPHRRDRAYAREVAPSATMGR
ncbi:MAG TPA: mycothiol synthase [Acidimicrobiia bacterium]|nr:mycothiol synthase [Acidimicrobiia bacterium]